MTHPQRWFFASILVLAALLRFVQLGSIPYGVNQDEADRVYEAYSLIKTGHDIHGNRWPLTLEAYGTKVDNASAISVYAALPFVALFGPSVTTARLPSAIAGTLTVLFVMLVGYQLSKRWSVGLLAGLMLAVSPWHLDLSRVGHEAVWTPLLFLVGLYAFLQAVERKRPLWLFVAALAWVIDLYGYPIAKLFLPLMLVTLGCAYWKQLWSMRRWVLLATGCAALLLIPEFHLIITRFGDAGRLREISIFTNGFSPWWEQLLKNFVSYINPVGWVTAQLTAGPLDWLAALLGLPFFFLLVRRSGSRVPTWFFAAWLCLAILPAIINDLSPHQLRGAFLIGPLSIIGAWGIVLALAPLYGRVPKRLGYVLLGLALIPLAMGPWFFWQPSNSLAEGFSKTHVTFTPEMETLSKVLQTKFANVPEVWIQDAGLNQPQIFFMLFQRWDPSTLGRDHTIQENSRGWYRTVQLGRYHFCQYGDCPVEKLDVIFVELGYHTNLGRNELARIPIRSTSRPGLSWIISGN